MAKLIFLLINFSTTNPWTRQIKHNQQPLIKLQKQENQRYLKILDFDKVTNLLQTPITVASSGRRWSSLVGGLLRPPMFFFFMGYVCSWCVFLFVPADESRWVEWKWWKIDSHCFFVLGKEKRKRNALFYTMDIVSNRLIQLSNRF